MADSAVAITAGSGTNVDTRTEATNGDHRQVVVIGDPSLTAGVAAVNASGELSVIQPNTSGTGTITATDGLAGVPDGLGTVITTAPTASSFVALALAGGESTLTLYLSGTFGSGTVYFEGSVDSTTGSDGGWVLVQGRQIGSLNAFVPSFAATTGGMYRIPVGGFNYFRVRIKSATSPSVTVKMLASDGASTVTLHEQITPPQVTKATQSAYGFSTQDLKDAGRTYVSFWANAAAAGATTVETAITLTRANTTFGGATSTGTSHTPTSGKRFRIQQILVGSRGNNTATAQITTFNLRVNTAGAVTTSSNIVTSTATATPATANAWDRALLTIPDGFEIPGNGTLQWGITAAATFTTNAPTWFVNIIGFEY